MSEIIYSYVYSPGSSLSFTKAKMSDPAVHTTITCSNKDKCELYKQGRCVLMNISLACPKCPYGTKRKEIGPTRRAKSFYSWTSERNKEFGHKLLNAPEGQRMAIIGDYIYLPYNLIQENEEVPFEYKGTFSHAFLKLEDFTVENIQKILDFKPKDIFNQVISAYQNKYMVEFKGHLAEMFPDLVEKLGLNIQLKIKGRKAFLKTLKWGIKISHKNIEWFWNGKELTTKAFDSYHLPVDTEECEVKLTPSDKATVIVEDESWYIPGTTKFAD